MNNLHAIILMLNMNRSNKPNVNNSNQIKKYLRSAKNSVLVRNNSALVLCLFDCCYAGLLAPKANLTHFLTSNKGV